MAEEAPAAWRDRLTEYTLWVDVPPRWRGSTEALLSTRSQIGWNPHLLLQEMTIGEVRRGEAWTLEGLRLPDDPVEVVLLQSEARRDGAMKPLGEIAPTDFNTSGEAAIEIDASGSPNDALYGASPVEMRITHRGAS